MTAPRISVLLPAKNAEGTIELAVRSVLAQTFDDFELIAINDGSTDSTREKIEALNDPRIRVLTTTGLGIPHALNLGLSEARGELIARMDGDDESLPTRFELSVKALDENPSWVGVGTGVEIFRDEQPPSPNFHAYGQWLSSLTTPELLFRDRFIESPLCHPTMLLRAQPLRELGAWRDGDFPEDWELWLRFLEAGQRMSCLPHMLHRWRDSDTRATRKDVRYSLDKHLTLKADYLARLFAKVPLTLWGATDTGRELSKRLTARGCTIVRFIELNPRKLGQTIHGVPVLHPNELPDDGSHILSCVAAKGARDEIRSWMTRRGKEELKDFTCVA